MTVDKLPPAAKPDPEFEALCRIAMPTMDTASARILGQQLDAGAVDAGRLANLSSAHGLMPMCYRHLVAERPDFLPAEVRKSLRAEFQAHALTRFRFARRLEDLLAVLRREGIEALPYKGPALAAQLYGHYAARQYGDLDLLVRPEQAQGAVAVLARQGVVQADGISGRWNTYMLESRHNFGLHDRQSGVLVELHWALTNAHHGFSVEPGWLLAEPDEITLLNRSVPVMSPTRTLVALVVHGAKHLWERIGWLAEVSILIEDPRIDWDAVLHQADRGHFRRHLLATIHLCHEFFGTDCPDSVRGALRSDRAARRLATRIRDDVLLTQHGSLDFLTLFRLSLMSRPGPGHKARFLWRLATFPSEADLRAHALSPRMRPLYAFLRPWRLARKAGRQLGTRVRRDRATRQRGSD